MLDVHVWEQWFTKLGSSLRAEEEKWEKELKYQLLLIFAGVPSSGAAPWAFATQGRGSPQLFQLGWEA